MASRRWKWRSRFAPTRCGKQIGTVFAGLNAFSIVVEVRRARLLAGIRSALALGIVRFRVESVTRGYAPASEPLSTPMGRSSSR
jgi:hypothetical protein